MVGEVEGTVRELMLLLLMAFAQNDGAFLSEVVLMLASESGETDRVDADAFREELDSFIAKYRELQLSEVQLGPMLQELTAISVRHHIRLPASLALAGKAFAQMQGVASELDPTVDPLSVAGSFVLRNVTRQIADVMDPKKLFYQLEKAKFRVQRFIEAVEGITGARPGGQLRVNFQGTERLEGDGCAGESSLGLGSCGHRLVDCYRRHRGFNGSFMVGAHGDSLRGWCSGNGATDTLDSLSSLGVSRCVIQDCGPPTLPGVERSLF